MSPHECGLATPWLMVKVGGSGNSQGFTLGYIGIAPSGAQAILCARQSLTAIILVAKPGWIMVERRFESLGWGEVLLCQ